MTAPADKQLARKKLALAMCDYLQQCVQTGAIQAGDDAESVEVAVQCIAQVFGIDPSDKTQQSELSIKPASLMSIFEVFLSTQKKVGDSTSAGSTQATTPSAMSAAAEPAVPSAADKAKAEDLKVQGNKFMAAKDYAKAIDMYTEAISIDSVNPIYYGNRAAAYSQNGQHQEAATDARKSIELDSSYSKGYSRLGHALFCLSDFAGSVEAYEKGLEIEPGNASMQQALKTAKAKISSPIPKPSDQGRSGGPGDFDFASMLRNPDIMNMAASMMGNPAIASMMNNPQIASMMNNPQLGEMMKDPQVAQMAQQLMQDPDAMKNMLNNPKLAELAKNLK